jgi:AraC family transcriptional regulator of adaptative response / DNA-3-methyladenine glycosylase II
MKESFDRLYGMARGRQARFDGCFIEAVTSTGIYCRPSCPAVTPRPENVRYFPTAAAAQAAGFRACLRCRPDAAPGSPEWNARDDVVGRAMRLINDGVVDREGVAGLAKRLAYTERHLHRLLFSEVGAGPMALARARRAHTARLLLETTGMPVGEVAFAAGFGSVRQFNETIRTVFARTPSELRRRGGAKASSGSASGEVALRLPYREPFDGASLLRFLGERAVPGVEEYADGLYRRTLRLPRGAGVAELSQRDGYVRCVLRLEDPRDLGSAVERCRRLLDLDADPAAVAEALAPDPLLGPLVRGGSGRRIPRSVDGAELAFRAVLGQQVSVAGARKLAGRLVALCGPPLPETLEDGGGLGRLFPGPEEVAGADLPALPMPSGRREALRRLAVALADGSLSLGPGADRDEAREGLLRIKGIGPWTASYVAMRALGDPDAFLPTDLGVRRAVERLGRPGDPKSVDALAERWRPWRAYAVQHLWASLGGPAAEDTIDEEEVA